MERDQIYLNPDDKPEDGSFVFNEAVARVFPDMLRRSIPGYGSSLQAIETLAHRHVQPNTRCYDLGCSLGAATLAMASGSRHDNCRIIAVDSSPAMVKRCREIIDAAETTVPVDVECADVRETDIQAASMVVMNYTLQFVPPEDRQSLTDRIARGLRAGGLLLLSEKLVDEDPAVNDLLVEMHHDFKRQQNYSDAEIASKRAAIENVLIPDTLATHRERLLRSGFRTVGVWLRHFNFVSMIAVR